MLSHPIVLENNNICEPKGTMNGHNREMVTNLHCNRSCDLGMIFSEFIQLSTPMRHAPDTHIGDGQLHWFLFKSYIILNNQAI